MRLNKPSGNMYPWAWTANPLRGACPHACDYCYGGSLKKRLPEIKKKYRGPIELDEKDLKIKTRKIPDDKIVFVCSMTDLFAEAVSSSYIERILGHCRDYAFNTYLFQTKNPSRFDNFIGGFPKKTILGVTLETNRNYEGTKAPSPVSRAASMTGIWGIDTMVSIEPIMDFDLEFFVSLIRDIGSVRFVSVGADSEGNNLPEPTYVKVKALIKELETFTEIKMKKNLERLKK